MLWKVGANILCVVICKPNGMDDNICIWELDDGLNVHFKSQKWKVLLIMNIMLPIPLSMLVGVNHLVFNLTIEQLLLSYHLMLQAWCNTWVKEWLFHSKLGIRISFWNATTRVYMTYLTKMWRNSVNLGVI
jgi:hypothetical protein